MGIRILVAVGIVRVIIRGERVAGGLNGLDWLMVMWATWALMSSVFHADISKALVNRLGLIYNACGSYFLLRVFCQSFKDCVMLCCLAAVLLVPVSVLMLFEKLTGHNLFSVLGDGPEIAMVRDGAIRAQGPFGHAILAGTVGAVCLPLMIGIWKQYRKIAVVGIVACSSMIITSFSSGPIMSALFAIGALLMWRWRNQIWIVRWLAVFGYIGLDLIMNAPAYYLIARINPISSSTSWHRSALIDAAIQHLSDWWLTGTDVTRHWMPSGSLWSEEHTDITNHYLVMGVAGGLPLMFLFIGVLAMGYSFVGQMLKMSQLSLESRFMIWALGASLFAHTLTFVSISYFDQSFVFLYLTLAVIGSAWSKVAQRSSQEVVHGELFHKVGSPA